jgi:hypothetical protein
MSRSASESPHDGSEAGFDSSDSPLLIIDGPWDSTVRPRRPNSPRYFPGRTPPEEEPSAGKQPPANPAPDKS